jgi:hypothetical protein
MKYVEKALVCIGCLLALSFAAQAVTADSSATSNPYQGIVDRNVFGLKPAPPPPVPVDTKPPPPKITLTGITTIFGNKRALMKAPVAAKPPEPAHDQTYMLAEGQRDGDIEVLEIDAKANIVKVNNGGTIMTLNFDDNGVKLSSTLPAGAPVPGMAQPAPGGIPAPTPFASPGFNKSIPTRTLRLPSANGASVVPGGVNPTGVAAAAPNGASLPGFSFGGSGAGSTTTGQQTPSAADTLTPEEREIVIAAQHQDAVNKNLPSANIFPPTQLYPNRNRNMTPTARPSGF